MPQPPRNRRLAAHLYEIAGLACAFTIRTALHRSIFDDPRYARIAVDCLLGEQQKSECRLDVHCVMPDHIHLIVTPEHDGNSSLRYVDRFKGWCSHELHRAGWRGDVWQPRSYDHLLRDDEDLRAASDYTLANPVRKGLAAIPEDYPWSGIHPSYRSELPDRETRREAL